MHAQFIWTLYCLDSVWLVALQKSIVSLSERGKKKYMYTPHQLRDCALSIPEQAFSYAARTQQS